MRQTGQNVSDRRAFSNNADGMECQEGGRNKSDIVKWVYSCSSPHRSANSTAIIPSTSTASRSTPSRTVVSVSRCGRSRVSNQHLQQGRRCPHACSCRALLLAQTPGGLQRVLKRGLHFMAHAVRSRTAPVGTAHKQHVVECACECQDALCGLKHRVASSQSQTRGQDGRGKRPT